jgi:hypothetical protein
MLLSQTTRRDDEQRLIVQPSAPPQIPTAMPIDRGWTDLGMTIAVVGWIGSKVWTLFSKQQSAEAQMNRDLLKALTDLTKTLATALVERKS